MTSDLPNSRQARCGFSLIECLIATLLFTLSCLGILTLYQHQILTTQSLLRWHDASEAASLKGQDLHQHTLQSHTGSNEIETDAGGTLAAGNIRINKNGHSSELQRHWHVKNLKAGSSPVKQATITVTFLSEGVRGKVQQRVILWHPAIRGMPRAEQFNPDIK